MLVTYRLYLHLKSLGWAPYTTVKLPINSLVALFSTLRAIELPLTSPLKRAGCPSSSSRRTGPPCSENCFPETLKRPYRSSVIGSSIVACAQSYSIDVWRAVTSMLMCCPPHVPVGNRLARGFSLIDASVLVFET